MLNSLSHPKATASWAKTKATGSNKKFSSFFIHQIFSAFNELELNYKVKLENIFKNNKDLKKGINRDNFEQCLRKGKIDIRELQNLFDVYYHSCLAKSRKKE